MAKRDLKSCQLCLRTVKDGTTEHHLIPRKCHSNKWFQKRFSRAEMAETVDLCRACHQAVHRLIPSEKELGRERYTLELLSTDPRIAKFLTWVRKQK